MTTLQEAIAKHESAVIMTELPTDVYLDKATDVVKFFVGQGFSGVYVSFQRPFKNLSSFFKKKAIKNDRIYVVDAASACSGADAHEAKTCVPVSEEVEIDELVRAIYTSLDKLDGKKFIFVDSLTTMTLHKPLSDTMRFSDFLIRTVRKGEVKEVVLVFNVAADLTHKKFIRDIAMQVDEVVKVT
ncbi:MAG: hypothetical protein HYS81_01530 [Candidatus Aenigmatarchaeota archaeon]|nr:MAG: hypothetical protein HYS81_01530 [Candidatus Aenigmarchaeota archaeon]